MPTIDFIATYSPLVLFHHVSCFQTAASALGWEKLTAARIQGPI